jgi:penicillin-binding protein 2
MPIAPIPKKNKKRKKRRQTLSAHALFSRRTMAVSAFFVAVCLVYCAILITLQAKGNAFYIFKDKPDVPKGTTVKTVAVQAMRGEIYDRNGVPLVTNLYSYDLTLDHDPFVTTQGLSVRHRVLLSLMEHLTQPGSGQLTEDSFPLVGTYPDLSYSEEAKDPSTTVGRRLGILLSRVGLPEGASADALVSYYVNHYSLNTRVDGIPSYTGEEITSLLRIYYDMDLCQFGDASSEYTLAKGVSAALISAAKETDMVGVRFVVRSERVYHYPGYASHILGRVNKIFAEDWDYYNSLGYPMNAIVGVSGCEAAFESILHGTDGELELYVDEQGRVVSSRVTKEAIAGQDIRLTIDINLQMAAEDALREKLAEQGTGPKKGSVVAVDPDTGAYLAIASYPTFDLTHFNEQYSDLAANPALPMLNRALSGLYLSGNLSKLTTSIAGVCEGLVTPSTLLEDKGSLTVGNYTVLCPLLYRQDNAHGTLGLSTALSDGCDVFFGKLGQMIGIEKMKQYEALLGLGQKTGLSLGEGVGMASTLGAGDELALLRASIGESDASMTPAQMAQLMAILVNGGTRYRGHILYDVRNFTSGDIVEKTKAEKLSSLPLTAEGRHLLLKTLSEMAGENAFLSDCQTQLGKSGVLMGSYEAVVPSGTVDKGHSVLLSFATPIVSLTGQPVSSLALSVVVENGGETVFANDIVSALMQEYYQAP